MSDGAESIETLMARCENMMGFLGRKYARSYSGLFPFEELLHIARISVWRSAEKWINGEREKKQIKFTTFAYGWIRHDLTKHVLEMRDTIRVSRQRNTEKQYAKRVRMVSMDELMHDDSTEDRHSIIADSQTASIYNDDDLEILERCLRTLNAKDRHVIHQRFFDELTFQECADQMGVTREAMRQREAKALRILRQRMAAAQRSKGGIAS